MIQLFSSKSTAKLWLMLNESICFKSQFY